MSDIASQAETLRIGYLTSQYPATSHTFISREVQALRALGMQLHTFSIREPSESELRTEGLRREADTTFTVLSQPLLQFVAAQAKTLLTRPADYFRTLVLALRHRPPGLRGFAMSFVYFAEALVLASELRRERVTRLHNHFANAGAIVGMLAAHLLRLPWSFTMHGISETDYPAGLMLGRKIEAAEFVACVSYFGRSQAMRMTAYEDWPKFQIIRCGLDLAALPQRTRPASGMRMISVGRLSPEKGQAGLLAAFAEARKDHPSLELVLVGDGPERTDLERLAEELHLSAAVSFAGRCGEKETLEHIANSDCLLLTSFMEGLPVVLIEAMALGTPVIASRVAGIPELVQDGETGLLFTPSDWNELASCICKLMGNSALRDKVTGQARMAVEQGFDIKQSANQLAALFLDEGAA